VLLALDTSTLTASLALVEGAGSSVQPIETVEVGPPQKQSEILPGAVMDLLGRHRCALKDLQGIVIGLGPGSFTGLRIGLASVKALAYAAHLPVVGASSLAAAAFAGPPGALFATAVARRGELYVGAYRRTAESVEASGPEEAMTPREFAELLLAQPEALALGPAIPSYRAELEQAGVPAERLLEQGLVPSAVALARLARLPPAYDAQQLFALEPHYVRASEAERNPKFPPLPGPEPAARVHGRGRSDGEKDGR
jgi:tRNA threonylcarbamoyladenosine biosynthesis protein TsaB